MPSKIRIVLEGYARYRDGKKVSKKPAVPRLVFDGCLTSIFCFVLVEETLLRVVTLTNYSR